jgi:hypothetical protein
MADDTQETSPEDVQQQARQMGWQPQEQWKGNPDNWVDAPEFVKRGETFVPFLQHDRKKLKAELDGERQARLALEAELRSTRASVEEVKKFSEDMAKERAERRKVEIGQELKAAREAGDDVKVAELQNELGEAVKKPEVKPNGAPAPPQQPAIQPWVKQFLDSNEEFFKNGRKLALFNAVMLEKRQAGDARVGDVEGTAILTEVREEVERALGGNTRRTAPPKTEESRSSGEGGGQRGGGKGYADLPPEARTKCDSQEVRFTGKGKAFKDQAAWRKHFVTEYFGPSAVQLQRGE